MYRHERSKTPDRHQNRHIAAKIDEKTVTAPISNQFVLSRNITQMQSSVSDSCELHDKLAERINFRRNNTGLPDRLKAGVETLSGYSLDRVKVHYNSSKPAQLNALAYTQGTDIHIAPGQEKHLPHETWHVVQQMQGRVRPTLRMNGVGINDNSALEHEASVFGDRASHVSAANAKAGAVQATAQRCIQCVLDDEAIINMVINSNAGKDMMANPDNYADSGFDNYFNIQKLILNAIKKLKKDFDPDYTSYASIELIAGKLNVPIPKPVEVGEKPEEETEEEAEEEAEEEVQEEDETEEPEDFAYDVDRSKFSVIPSTCSDKQLYDIQNNPRQSPIKVRVRGTRPTYIVYHIAGSYPSQGKPLWIIEDNGKYRIIGMFEHRGNNRVYYRMDNRKVLERV